ncbi:MAG: glutathione peroxidase [Acidobacteriia bacterium]|nr:glutathione peroxidase [Terriglobia bacterium]
MLTTPKITCLAFGLVLLTASALFAASSVYDFALPSIDGQDASLGQFKGKVLLLVNVASKCGYTPQYAGLEALYEKYKDQGLVVVGFPANNFGAQEPGTNAEIKTFCTHNYHVSFPMYAKVSVKGEDKTPLYHYLTEEANPATNGEIGWNFTKFLVDRSGKVVARFESKVKPDDAGLVAAVEKALNQ